MFFSYYEKIGSEIKDVTDEIPFDIPDNWSWTRLSSIIEIKSGNTYPSAMEKEVGEKLYVKVGDMNLQGNEFEILTSSRFVDEFKEEHLIYPPSIIFPKRGGAISTNKKKLVLKDSILIDLNTMGITPYEDVEIMYLYYWFQSVDLSKLYNGTSIPQINNKDIIPLLIPIPPLTEQKEICKKITALYEFVSEIEKSLS